MCSHGLSISSACKRGPWCAVRELGSLWTCCIWSSRFAWDRWRNRKIRGSGVSSLLRAEDNMNPSKAGVREDFRHLLQRISKKPERTVSRVTSCFLRHRFVWSRGTFPHSFTLIDGCTTSIYNRHLTADALLTNLSDNFYIFVSIKRVKHAIPIQ